LIDDLRLLEAPGPWWTQWWAIALGALLFGAVLFLVWRRVRHLARKQEDLASVGAVEAAGEDALAELTHLFSLVEQEQSRPYAIDSSGIIRRYIERRFEIRAPLRSTEEFLVEALVSPKLADQHQSLLGEFLGACDFLKFARGRANRTELEGLHQSAVAFVKATLIRNGTVEVAA